jgi:uncharacterized protein YeaO (DUF488 family)
VAAHQVHAARVYGPQPAAGATRVLVDRLWPRGISKAAAPFGEWLRDVAPSTELRKWYGHDPVKLGEFTSRYRQDLALLTAVKDLDLSHAEVLATLLRDGTTFI